MAEHAPHPIDLHVGRLIRARRKQLNMSQAKLAAALGLSFQQIQKYERAANRVSCSALVGLAAALDCAPADLLPRGEGQLDLGPELELAGAPNGRELAQSYLALPPRHQQSLISVVRALRTTTAVQAGAALAGLEVTGAEPEAA